MDLSAEVGAASELEELLEGDLSTAATAVCKYTNRAGGTSHFARLIRTASQLQDYSAPVTRNTEHTQYLAIISDHSTGQDGWMDGGTGSFKIIEVLYCEAQARVRQG